MGPFEGGHHYLHYLHHSLASGQTTGREHSPSTENWIKDLLSMALPIRTRLSFPLSLSHQEASISLLPFSIRGRSNLGLPHCRQTLYRLSHQGSPSTENGIKDLLRMALPFRTRSSFPLSLSLPSGSFHKPRIHQRADRMKTTITEN